ncbi:MAG TPA: hypothetical protein VHD69_03075 [Candidatus Paceibacterota bacterium]|nr:hypothetical protein [Candidatus Paceibacterota bacterium]
MLSRLSIKAVGLILLVSLIVPAALFSYPPKPVEAASSCASVVAGAVASAIGLSAAAKVVGVTVSAPGGDAASIVGAGAAYGSFFQDCVLKPIAIRLGKAMLQNITGSIVQWINNGFHGNPSFVQNLHGLIQDTTDMAIGEFIDRDLGAGFLCNPFSLQVRIAVAQSYLPYNQRYSCTLSQIENNVTGFVDNNNSGGWDNWIQVATQPQNNVYGATVLAQDELTRRIAQKMDIQNRELDWGKGFRSWTVCTDTYDGSDPSKADPTSENCADAETRTPGTVVESQLELTLGSGVRQLEVANDLDAIVGALTNQLMSQVVTGAQGLLGAGKRSNGSYNTSTYSSALAGSDIDPAFTNAVNTGIGNITNESGIDSAFNNPSEEGVDTADIADANDESSQPLVVAISVDDKTSTARPGLGFLLGVSVTVNRHATNMSVTSTLKLKSNGALVPFGNPFQTFQAASGRTDGTTIVTYPTADQSNIAWSNVSADENAPYKIRFTGTVRSDGRGASAAMPGTYIITTTVSDGEGGTKTLSSEFTIQ